MTPEMLTALSGLGVSGITAIGAVWVARAGRRTAKQERRDDFTAITTQQSAAIERLEARISRQEAEAEKQRERIGDQDEAIGWLLTRVRDLVSHIRGAGMEPPAAPPMSDRARQHLRHIDT